MAQKNLVKLQCTSCKRTNYWTKRNKRKVEKKLEMKKYCPWERKHTIHKETKK